MSAEFNIKDGVLLNYDGTDSVVTIPEGIEEIGQRAFFCNETIKEVIVPDTVVSLEQEAFAKCKALTEVVLPPAISYIGKGAFRNCESLKEIEIPQGTDFIGEFAFYGCKQLNSIDIPDSVTEIGQNTFGSCIALTGVSFGEGMTDIPQQMFENCLSLELISISKNIRSIGNDAFTSCANLLEFIVDRDNMSFSAMDGILFNKDGTELIFCPGGKKRIEYIVPGFVTAIDTHAFIDCYSLRRVVIPGSVSVIGDEVFPRDYWNRRPKLTDIEVSPEAGTGRVGVEVFDFKSDDAPLIYPKLPVTFVKEKTVQVRLGMGYCRHPEKYEGEYADIYRKYVTSHKKTIINKAKKLGLKDVEEYYSATDFADEGKKAAFRPDVSQKKLNELAKVELLEETVQKGTLEDVKLVLETYKPFEITARALGLAARYRGLEFVRELIKAGASFEYDDSSAVLQRKYKMIQKKAGSYRTEYYLMLVPEKMDMKIDKNGGSKYSYTPLCGVPAMSIPDKLENNVLSIEERFETVKFCWENENLNVSLDEMLFWALTRNELKFADLLIDYGADLNTTAPNYYITYGPSQDTYIDIITSGKSSVYWNEYVNRLTELNEHEVYPVLERFNRLAAAAGKKLVINQRMFDNISWKDKSFAFALENIDFSKINQMKAMELAVDKNFIASLDIIAKAGWLSTTVKREKLIEYASANNKIEVLAWLMDFKHRTADLKAEAAREEARIMRELNEKPGSVSALKKIWGYRKLDDGTLLITGYKGNAIDVEVPASIGKASVTVIGENAFSANSRDGRIRNTESRKRIRSITIPEGVVEIKSFAFWELDSLEKITLPSTVREIGAPMAIDCKKLKEVNIPAGADARYGPPFSGCYELYDRNGCIIRNNCLYGHNANNVWSYPDNIIIPENVTEISGRVFYGAKMSSITLPDGLKVIGERAFESCPKLKEADIPGSVQTIRYAAFRDCYALQTVRIADGVISIGDNAFESCRNLQDVYIPKSVKKLGKDIFNDSKWSGLCVHTQKDSAAAEYLENKTGIKVAFDYEEGESDGKTEFLL